MTGSFCLLPIGPDGARRKVPFPLKWAELMAGELEAVIEECRDQPPGQAQLEMAVQALRLCYEVDHNGLGIRLREQARIVAAWGATLPTWATLASECERCLAATTAD